MGHASTMTTVEAVAWARKVGGLGVGSEAGSAVGAVFFFGFTKVGILTHLCNSYLTVTLIWRRTNAFPLKTKYEHL